MAPRKTPVVVGHLLDLDCSEEFISQLLNAVGQKCSVDELVDQVQYCCVFLFFICISPSATFKMEFTPGANASKWILLILVTVCE